MEGGTLTVYFDADHPTAINLPCVPNDGRTLCGSVGYKHKIIWFVGIIYCQNNNSGYNYIHAQQKCRRMDVADFFGIATGNKMDDKFERTGYHAVKSGFVNAPIIEEFPIVMECEWAEVSETESFYAIVGKIINTAAEESVLSENDKVDPSKLQALIFDQFQHGYYISGEQVGKAWNAGAGLMKK